jgi:hypothetical protein
MRKCLPRDVASPGNGAAEQDTARVQIDRFPADFREVVAGVSQTEFLLLGVFGDSDPAFVRSPV